VLPCVSGGLHGEVVCVQGLLFPTCLPRPCLEIFLVQALAGSFVLRVCSQLDVHVPRHGLAAAVALLTSSVHAGLCCCSHVLCSPAVQCNCAWGACLNERNRLLWPGDTLWAAVK
jgi:hypothetical protein